MDKNLGSSITVQEAELVKDLCINFKEIDHPERRKHWLETIHREILHSSFCIPEDYDYSYRSDPELLTALRDRNYPCLDKSKPELINGLV